MKTYWLYLPSMLFQKFAETMDDLVVRLITETLNAQRIANARFDKDPEKLKARHLRKRVDMWKDVAFFRVYHKYDFLVFLFTCVNGGTGQFTYSFFHQNDPEERKSRDKC